MTIAFTDDFKIMDKEHYYHNPFCYATYAYFDKIDEFLTALTNEGVNTTGVDNFDKDCHFAVYVDVPLDSDEIDRWEEVTDKEILDKLTSALPQKDKIILPLQVIENFDNLISLYNFCTEEKYNNKIFKEMAEIILNN